MDFESISLTARTHCHIRHSEICSGNQLTLDTFQSERMNGVSKICAGALSIRWGRKQAHVARDATWILVGGGRGATRAAAKGGRLPHTSPRMSTTCWAQGARRPVFFPAQRDAPQRGLRCAAQWNRVRVQDGWWQHKSSGTRAASEHNHLRCVPSLLIFDSEGIRTPAGRAQWISSPSP